MYACGIGACDVYPPEGIREGWRRRGSRAIRKGSENKENEGNEDSENNEDDGEVDAEHPICEGCLFRSRTRTETKDENSDCSVVDTICGHFFQKGCILE